MSWMWKEIVLNEILNMPKGLFVSYQVKSQGCGSPPYFPRIMKPNALDPELSIIGLHDR